MVDTILKWAGGKEQLLDELYARFPSQFNRYHEPMIGGGALFFDLEPENATINDTNPRLINFYHQVRENPDALIHTCRAFHPPESQPDPSQPFADTDRKGREIKNYYYQQRALFNRRPNDESFDPLKEAALLLYLNRTCYNGLYRENSAGEFNVPIGRYENPDWVRESQVRAASHILQHTTIYNKDFTFIEKVVAPKDLVYFDPPYKPMSPTATFTEYNAAGFNQHDQKRLLNVCQALDEQGVYVVVSNSGIMYDTYTAQNFHVDTVGAVRAINSDPDKRGEVEEIIATNIPWQKRQKTSHQATLETYEDTGFST